MEIKKNIYNLYLSLIKKNKYFYKKYINSLNKRSKYSFNKSDYNYLFSNLLEDIHKEKKIS